MIEFKYLKKLIIKACKTAITEDLNKAYKFTINKEKLQNNLDAAGANLKVINCFNDFESNPNIESYNPSFKDIMLISEYIQKKNEIENIFNDRTHVTQFLLYIPNNEGEDNIDKLLKSDNIDYGTITKIVGELTTVPVYRVFIVRKFNKKREMFEYSIYFRSNNIMMEYINNIKESGEEFITIDSEEENNIEE